MRNSVNQPEGGDRIQEQKGERSDLAPYNAFSLKSCSFLMFQNFELFNLLW